MKEYILFPLIGAVIGWLTNFIAIKLLFHPRKKIWFVQGLIPKRKRQIAQKISHTSFDIMPEKFLKFAELPFIGEKIENYFKTEVQKKVENFSDEELEKIVTHISGKELKFIEISGGILGFLIGVIEVIILNFI